MSASVTVKFDYADINDAQGYVDKLVSSWWGEGYNFYETAMDTSIKGSLTGGWLEASSPYGASYVEDAASDVGDKCTALTTMAGKWQTVSTNLGNYVQFLKDTDDKVQGIFDTLSAGYVDYSGFWGKCQWLSDAIFNFCTVDMVNWNVVTRTASDLAQRANSYIEEWTQDVEEWFKYGYGKYVVDIVASIAGAGLAIIGAVAAFLAIPFTGGSTSVVVVGCITFAATSISALIKTGNSVAAISQDVRGMACLDEDPGQARFYGTTQSMSSFVARNDLGSQEFNTMAAETTGVIDTVQAGADAIAVVTGGVSTLGTKTTVGLNGQKLYTFDFSRQNMTNNIWKTFGITRTQNTNVYNTTNSSVQVTQLIPDQAAGLNVMDDASLALTAAKQNTYSATLSKSGYKQVTLETMSTKTKYASMDVFDGTSLYSQQQMNMSGKLTTTVYDYSAMRDPVNAATKIKGDVAVENMKNIFHWGDDKIVAFQNVMDKTATGLTMAQSTTSVLNGNNNMFEATVDYHFTGLKYGAAVDKYLLSYEKDEKGNPYLQKGGTSALKLEDGYNAINSVLSEAQ